MGTSDLRDASLRRLKILVRWYLFVAAVNLAAVVMAACGNGSPPTPVVGDQTDRPSATAAPPAATLAASPTTPAANALGMPEPVTLAAEEPFVDPAGDTQAGPDVPTPTSVAAATEAPTQPAAQAEVSLDLGADPSGPDTRDAGQTLAQPALRTGDTDLSAVEVVKILAPSVVQIANESIAIGAFNRPFPVEGVGTGVIIDAAGHILTSSHLVERVQAITVVLNTGERYEARVVGTDPTTDTSVIAIDAEGLQPAKLGVSANLEVGEEVISIGHALGLRGGPSVSKGVVSALGRSVQHGNHTLVDLIQTDASINPGNSGGPLVNMRAEVVGINAAIIPGSQGIGFAINIDDTQVVAAQLIENGRVERGFLGITPFNLTPALAQRLGVPVEEGIVVAGLVTGTGADSADLKVEDVIVGLGGKPITNTGELSRFLLTHSPGSTVEVEYYRRETQATARITLGTSPG